MTNSSNSILIKAGRDEGQFSQSSSPALGWALSPYFKYCSRLTSVTNNFILPASLRSREGAHLPSPWDAPLQDFSISLPAQSWPLPLPLFACPFLAWFVCLDWIPPELRLNYAHNFSFLPAYSTSHVFLVEASVSYRSDVSLMPASVLDLCDSEPW